MQDKPKVLGAGFARFRSVVSKETTRLVTLTVVSLGLTTALTAHYHRQVSKTSRISMIETMGVAMVCALVSVALLYVLFDFFPHEKLTKEP